MSYIYYVSGDLLLLLTCSTLNFGDATPLVTHVFQCFGVLDFQMGSVSQKKGDWVSGSQEQLFTEVSG